MNKEYYSVPKLELGAKVRIKVDSRIINLLHGSTAVIEKVYTDKEIEESFDKSIDYRIELTPPVNPGGQHRPWQYVKVPADMIEEIK